MGISIERAREFVYTHGVLWERLLFGHLFEGADAAPVRSAMAAYKNQDNGFGNAFEHDIRCPDSHPLALEFMLMVLVRCGLEADDLFDGTVHWLAMQREEDGSLRNPAAVLTYPHAPWWNEGGQTTPDSIAGNLTALGIEDDAGLMQSTSFYESTRKWVDANLTEAAIRAQEWLFMNYHAYDYFSNDWELPDAQKRFDATVENILRCAEAAPPEQHYAFFMFASAPDSPVALAADESLIQRCLNSVAEGQKEDGGWVDEHSLAQWRSWTTIVNLLTLKAYGRLD